MSIEFLQDEIELPLDREAIRAGGAALERYIVRLVRVLQEDRLRPIMQTVNLQLQQANFGTVYFAAPDENGEYANGTWRFTLSEEGIELQKKTSGSWVKQARWS